MTAMSDLSVIIPSAITGAVGVAGIGGTILAARMNNNAEDRRIQRTYKRELYSHCLAALDDLVDAAVSQLAVSKDMPGLTDVEAARLTINYVNSSSAALKSIEALILLAPDIYKLALEYYGAILENPTQRLDMEKIDLARDQMMTTMQAELEVQPRSRGRLVTARARKQ